MHKVEYVLMCCLFLLPLPFLLLLLPECVHSGQNSLVALRAVLEAAVDPADGGAAGPGPLEDVLVDHPVPQVHGHFDPLLHGLQLAHGAQILQEPAALLHILELEQAFVQQVVIRLWRFLQEMLLLRASITFIFYQGKLRM